MRLVMGGFVLGMGLCAVVPSHAWAAGNPAIDALSQGAVVQFIGKETVSEPFSFEVMIATKAKDLNLGSAVGQPIVLAVTPGRSVGGMVESVEQIDSATAQGFYKVRVVPSIERLRYRSASRTFYGMNAAQIVTAVLKEAGISNIESRIGSALPKKELTIQYRETDLAFVARLLEEAGIHYHFEAGDKLVLSDANAGFPAGASFGFGPAPGAGPSVVSFSRGQALHSGQVQAGDYNWKAPTADHTGIAQVPVFGDLTDHLFPAGIDSKSEAQAQAAVRLASHIAAAHVCQGESTIPQLQAGQRIALQGHPRPDFNQEYVILEVEHQRGKDYRNTFRCIPAQIAYRPQTITPKPVVAGVVSGIVVGPPGESKFVDQYGRVKVRFPWRAGQHSAVNDPGDAGFVRIGQLAAGAGGAALWLPDVGDEVLVAFEHGDPDRPVVVGSVYNGKDMPPVALPVNKHISVLRQQSSNGTRTELVFDGTPGSERLMMVSGQSGLMLGTNAVSLVSAGDLQQSAGGVVSLDARTNLALKAGQNLSVASQKDAVVSVAGNTQFTNGGSLQATIGNDAQLSVGRNLQATIGAGAVLESGNDLSIRAGQNFLLQSARAARLIAGEDAVIQTARSFILNAGAMFQFVAAQTGTIQAARGLRIQSDGDIDMIGKDIDAKASGNLTLKGSKITQN